MEIRQLQKKLLLKDFKSIPLVNYEPATLQEWETGWHIVYRVLNPETGTLERKKLRFEKIRKRLGNDTSTRKHAKLYCNAINEKLESGWNPYIEGRNAKSFHKLIDATQIFIKEKELDLKNGVFRADSMRTYRSQIDMLSAWLMDNNHTNIYVGTFSKNIAQDYLDHVYVTKQLVPRTWNNYLSFLRLLWNWLIEKDYCTDNIFTSIKPKPKTEKVRTLISTDWSNKIIGFFREHEPAMELICGFIYNSFMRPSEICRTQIKDVQIAKGGIYLTGKDTKNGKARWCLLPPHLIDIINKMEIDKYPSDYYLISSGLIPGKKLLCARRLDKCWEKMRIAIKLPKTMKLYSYRDTGITDLKKQGHSNLFISSITGHLNSEEIETYTHAPNIRALEYIIENSTKL